MNNKARYAKIDSMAKLRQEQMRLSWDIKLAESNMRNEYNVLKEKLSFSNIISSVLGGIGGGTTGIVTTVAGGVFSLISSMRKRKRRRN